VKEEDGVVEVGDLGEVVAVNSGTGPERGETTGGNRYNLHQLILPDASIPDLEFGFCVPPGPSDVGNV
jgi:hypothetical protein